MISKRFLLCCLLVAAIMQVNSQSVLYVSPSGSASNAGTSISAPTTLESAITKVTAGGTIYMRGGSYSYTTTIVIARGNNGTSSAYKNIVAYNSEVPVLSFSGQAVSSSNRGIVLDALYWHLTGLIIEGAGDNGMLLSGNNNIIEKCIFRKNRDSGLQLSRYNTSYTSISDWPSNNLILNCESYDNQDPDNEDADGFAAKLTCGTGNIFRGCVSHNNIDDGWDLYTKPDTGPIGAITLENCISHSNGTLTTGGTSGNGDKNGFKLGGEDISVNHIVRRCIAFNNGKHGFTYNRNLGTIEITNCTGYNNTERNFNFDGGTSVFKNNLSYLSGSNDRITGTATAPNSFTGAAGGFTINSADFVTLTPGPASNPTSNGFLNLASGSDAINAGVATTGITYNGSAPDLGAIESGSTSTTNYTLTVASSPSAGGSVSLSPSGGSYAAGTVVTLTATANSGYTFSNWSGSASGTSTSTTVTMNSNLSATANFTTTGSGGTGSTLRIEDNATSSTGLCSYDGSLSANTAASNGYVINLSNSSGKGITWSVNAGATGSYTLTWRYKNQGSQAATSAALKVNGTTVNSAISFPKTASSTTFTTTSATVTLNSGANTIRIETTQSSEFADIDYIEITGTSPTAGNCSGARLTNPANNENLPTLFANAGVYPNPTSGKVTIAFSLPTSQKVGVRVFNALGQQLDEVKEKTYAAGMNQFDYNGMKGRVAGNYYIVLTGQNGENRLFTVSVK